ncbi:hypothetical protein Tco_0015959 [Tanacetum coccineum]
MFATTHTYFILTLPPFYTTTLCDIDHSCTTTTLALTFDSSKIILEDIYNTFYKDEAEANEEAKLAEAELDGKDDKGKGKIDDKGKGKVDDKGKGKVDEKGNAKQVEDDVDLIDALDLQNRIKKLSEDFNRLLKAKKAKEAKEAELAEVVEVSSDEEDSSDEGFFGDEDLVLFNDVKYPLSDAEIRMFKERPTTSRAPTASTSTRSRAPTRSKAPITSTSNAQAASTAPRAMTGCVLALRAPNDPNAPPPSTTRKRKP